MTQYFEDFRAFAAVAWLAGSLLACSSKGPQATYWLPSGGASAEPHGGAAGEANVTPPAEGGVGSGATCERDADCNDELACNGVETCAAGSCIAGTPIECGEHSSCVEAEAGSCVFEDQSPWVAYTADDDVVAQPELYVVKRDLIGKMKPIKVNAPLAEGAGVIWPEWLVNRELLRYTIGTADYELTTKLVYFGNGLPREIASVEGAELFWSKSGSKLAVCTTKGLSIYEYTSGKELLLLFAWSAADEESLYGDWSTTDDFVFATRLGSDASRIYTTSHDQGEWQARVLVDQLNLRQLAVSPNDPEIVYAGQTVGTASKQLRVLATARGSEPKVLAESDDSFVEWSTDGLQYLLLRGQAPDLREALLGDGSLLAGRTTHLVETTPIRSATFAPDGRQILLYEPLQTWGQEIALLDPAVRTNETSRTLTRMSLGDQLTFRRGLDFVVAPSRQQPGEAARLVMARLGGGTTTLDEARAGEQITDAAVSEKGAFVTYRKGTEGQLDGYYVDLRYGGLGGYKPLRLPGEGRAEEVRFGGGGTSVYYVLDREDGARECWYLDLSGQTAAEPLKVSRKGRVLYCGAQL